MEAERNLDEARTDDGARTEDGSVLTAPAPNDRDAGQDAVTAVTPDTAGQNTAGQDALLRAATNPLVAAAAVLLELAGRLRDAPMHPEPEVLRERLADEIHRFESAAAAAGVGPEEIRVARFALAATLDDVVLSTSWGPRSVWGREGLVAGIEKMTGAAERFFDLMETMLADPQTHRRELELFYACLSLGFEGKFRDRPRGGHDLSHLRDNLFRLLRRGRPSPERELSPVWRGHGQRFRPLGRVIPTWVVAALASVALTLLFLHFAEDLGEQADRVAGRIAALPPDRPVEIARVIPPPPPSAGPALVQRVTRELEPEIRTQAVEVGQADDGALVVRLRGGNLFPAGSDTVRARTRAIVERIGETLAAVPGTVVVVGHTDDALPRNVRFPSPQALTEAQAEAVRKILERALGAGRLSAKGHGAEDPLVANTTLSNRALNRRIDILLYPR